MVASETMKEKILKTNAEIKVRRVLIVQAFAEHERRSKKITEE